MTSPACFLLPHLPKLFSNESRRAGGHMKTLSANSTLYPGETVRKAVLAESSRKTALRSGLLYSISAILLLSREELIRIKLPPPERNPQLDQVFRAPCRQSFEHHDSGHRIVDRNVCSFSNYGPSETLRLLRWQRKHPAALALAFAPPALLHSVCALQQISRRP